MTHIRVIINQPPGAHISRVESKVNDSMTTGHKRFTQTNITNIILISVFVSIHWTLDWSLVYNTLVKGRTNTHTHSLTHKRSQFVIIENKRGTEYGEKKLRLFRPVKEGCVH